MNRSIRYFQSQEIVKKRYRHLHSRAANTAKARSIALHVEQGVNFIESASRAPISIRPLAQFYGVAAIARAVTLFLKPDATESSLTKGHGLEITNWEIISDAENERGFPALELRTTRGLLSDLGKATGGLAHYHANSSAPNWTVKLGEITQGVTVSFANVLGLMPDLWDERSAWLGERSHRFELSSFNQRDNNGTKEYVVEIKTNEDPELCRDLFPNGLVGLARPRDGIVQVIQHGSLHFQPVQKHRGAFNIGDTLMVAPINSNQAFSTIAIYYMVAYTMSMLARYRLSDWLAVWRGEKGDAARPVLEQAMGLIQDEYLQVCAELLDGDMAAATTRS